MANHNVTIVILTFAIILFGGCRDNCFDYNPGPPGCNFRILDEANNNISNQGPYLEDSMTIMAMWSDGYTSPVDFVSYSSYYTFGTNMNVPDFVITYGNGDADTLSMEYIIGQYENCGELVTDFSAKLNGIDVCSECSNDIIEIVK